MGQIVITRKNGEKYSLAPKKEVASIKEAKQKWGLLGDDVVNITMESRIPQSYEIGDSINVFGRLYKLNQLPKVQKTGANRYSYELTFEGVQYDLLRAFYDVTIETTGNTLQDVQGDALTGNLRRFATVLIANANRVFPDMWRLGECPETAADKTLTFSDGDNCLAVFQSLCRTFEVEAEIVQKGGVYTINFAKSIGKKHAFVFEFGKGKGLYAINRQNVDSSNIVTRLKVYGSSDNITSRYRANRLCLPTKSKGQSFIEQKEAVAKYGVHEARKVFEEIKPTFNGRVSAIVEGNVLQFRDETMFDLNEKEADGKTTKYLVAGLSAKIHFNTGNLAGYEFEIQKYDHATKTFTIKKLTDDRGEVFPSEKSASFQFLVWDEYKILDVALPKKYQDEAEEKLLEKGLEYYKQNSQPRVKYGLSISSRILEKIFGGDESVAIYSPGDYVNVKDEGVGVEKAVRIQSLQRNLLNIYDYDLTLSDVAENSITTRVISDLITIDKIATNNRLKDPARAKANWQTSREVLGMVYDTDGYFDASNIKPNSIETNMLAVGAKSQQFLLRNVVFEANFGGDCNKFRASDGDIVHLTINEEGERTWTMSERIENLEEDKGYYVFAKCPKVGTRGMWHITTQQLKVENASDSDYYYFQVGIISSVRKGAFRDFVTTYGFTRINGNTITTGRVATTDGNNYLDLDGNQFRMGNNQSFIDWNITQEGQLTLHNVRLLSSSGDTAAIGVFRGEYNPSYTYYKGDEVTFATPDGTLATYRYINNVPSRGTSPLVASHWQAVARGLPGVPGQPGQDGKQGIPGEKGQDGRTTYFHIKYSDVQNPSRSSQMSEVPNTFIGTYVDFEEADSDDPNRYAWYRFQGLQGADGDQGIPGRNGSDGKTSYLHIKYSNDGGSSFTDKDGETVGDYIGQCTDFNEKDPNSPSSYKWSKTKGEQGERGNDGKNGRDGVTTQANMLHGTDFKGKILDSPHAGRWCAMVADNSVFSKGEKYAEMTNPIFGADTMLLSSPGNPNLSSAKNEYSDLLQQLDGKLILGQQYVFSVYARSRRSNSCKFWMIAYPAGPHTSFVATKEWQRFSISFSATSEACNFYLRLWNNFGNRPDGAGVYFAAPKLELDGAATPWVRSQADLKGDDGVGVSSVVTEYTASSSASSAPSSGWSTTMPTWQQGQYLWTRTRVTYSDGRITTTDPQVDSAWKKLSDLAWEQSHMAYLKQVFEQRAGIEGGLLFGSMLQMRDIPIGGATDGEVVAYLSGLRSTKVGNSPRPALALGISNFGKPEESEAIAMYHNGSGHIGDLTFSKNKESGKSTLYVVDNNGVERVNFSGEGMPTIDQLVARATVVGKIDPMSMSVSGVNLSGYWDVAQSGESPFFRATRATGTLRCRFRLSKQGVNYAPCILTLILKHRGANYHQPVIELGQVTEGVTSKEFNLDIPANLYPEQEYDLALVLSGYGAFNATGALEMMSPLTYTQTNQDPYTGVFADGIMAYQSPSQYTFIKDGKLHIKGKHDMPGLLASGKVDKYGNPESLWGSAIRVERRSTGEYLIHHDIGHMNYSIIISPIGNGNLMLGQLAMQTPNVAWCFIRDVQRNCNLTNTPFTFAIIGSRD